MILLLACTEPALEDTEVVNTQDSSDSSDTSDSEDTGSGPFRDILLVTAFHGSMSDEHQALKQQAAEILATLGDSDRLGLITDGADGCSQAGILTFQDDPSFLSGAFNVQEGPLSQDLLEATARAYSQTEAGCNVGLAREGSIRVVVLISDTSGTGNDLSEITPFSPTVSLLGSDCSGAYGDAVQSTGGTATCPWQVSDLLALLGD